MHLNYVFIGKDFECEKKIKLKLPWLTKLTSDPCQ